MRTILLLALAVGGAFAAGWFTIQRDGDRTLIEINKTEIRNDTRQAIDKGREMLDKREQERLANQQQQPGGYAPNQGNWPPQQAAPIQGAGYASPNPYGNQTGYNSQPYNGPQYNGQTAPNGYNPAYPSPTTNPQQRWTEMPPPWQQQTR